MLNAREIQEGKFKRKQSKSFSLLNQMSGFSLSTEEHKRRIAFLVDYLSRTFNVKSDEVAFLVLDRQGENLTFMAPTYLASLKANFPYDRQRSVAGRSLWDRKPCIQNKLPAVNHLSYFERLKRKNSRPTRIEKMLTYPVYVGSSPLGVVQISRKWTLGSPMPRDFRIEDIQFCEEIRGCFIDLFQGIRSVQKRKLAA